MAINYTPTFEHEDWIDNVDRVQAGGTNGFNIRFHEIQDEFGQIATAVGEIDAALQALGQAPPAQVLTTSITPTLVSTAATGWAHGLGFAQKPAGATSAQGMMSVDLPHGAVLSSFRATGRNENSGGGSPGSGDLRIVLRRQGIAPSALTSDVIARIDGGGPTFDLNVSADAQFAVVDNTQFRYFVTAQLNNAQATDTVLLFAFLVGYSLG